jgi:hypothetical protein
VHIEPLDPSTGMSGKPEGRMAGGAPGARCIKLVREKRREAHPPDFIRHFDQGPFTLRTQAL